MECASKGICRIVTIRHTLCRTEWVQSCYKRPQHVTCYQLAQNSFVSFTGKFQYLQILLLLPVLPNCVTCKIHGIHYPQFPLLANSSTVTFAANFHYLQIQPPLLPKSITCKFSAPVLTYVCSRFDTIYYIFWLCVHNHCTLYIWIKGNFFKNVSKIIGKLKKYYGMLMFGWSVACRMDRQRTGEIYTMARLWPLMLS